MERREGEGAVVEAEVVMWMGTEESKCSEYEEDWEDGSRE